MVMVDGGAGLEHREGVILITDGNEAGKPKVLGAVRVEGDTFVVLSEGPPPWTSADGAAEAE